MKYVASCSCGKDSLAMVLKLIEKEYPLDCVMFIDLGKEFKSIYKVWEQLTQVLKEHKIDFRRIELNHSFDYYFSEHEVKCRNGSSKYGYSWCGGRTRWGTAFKREKLKEFYKIHFGDEPIAEYVGIANDELDRVAIKRDKNIKIYPLILWGMSENDCLVYCRKHGFNWKEENGIDLYDVLDRVSCFCCGNKNLQELKAMYKYLPKYWEQLKEMQIKTEIPFKRDYSLEQLEARFNE